MNHSNARDRILNTAVKIFANKGYEGSRIDEIAREANVPKSLIYYHFNSKEEILRVLTDDFVKEYLDMISDTAGESSREKAGALQKRMKDRYYEFGQRNADLVRVILIESLKKTQENPVLFQVLEAMIEKEAVQKPDIDIQERRIAEFFTSFIPNYAYICFADSWIKYFGLDRKEFDRLYLEAYAKTHGEYHKNSVEV